MKYVVVGKFSEVDAKTLTKREVEMKLNKYSQAYLIVGGILFLTLGDYHLASAATSTTTMAAPQISTLFNFISYLVNLLKTIVTALSGLMLTVSGYKWFTSFDAKGQEVAKQIMKNTFIGSIIVWSGTSIADFFISKLNELL